MKKNKKGKPINKLSISKISKNPKSFGKRGNCSTNSELKTFSKNRKRIEKYVELKGNESSLSIGETGHGVS